MKKIVINDAKSISGEISPNIFRRVFVILDMLRCYVLFHILPSEYRLFGMNDISDFCKKNYLIRYDQYVTYERINNEFIHDKLNGYNGKVKEYNLLGKDLICREYIYLPESSPDELLGFVANHKKVVFKPNIGSLGNGVFVYDEQQGFDKLMEYYQKTRGNDYICEEFVSQHADMEKFHSSSLNTLRILALNDHGDLQLLGAFVRFGCSGAQVDNLSNVGIAANVDVADGTITTNGFDKNGNEYEVHPDSKIVIKGFKIPNWEKVLEVVEKAANIISNNPINGWDVAVTADSAAIIEVNNRPGTIGVQECDKTPKGNIVREYCKKYKKELNHISHKRLRYLKKEKRF